MFGLYFTGYPEIGLKEAYSFFQSVLSELFSKRAHTSFSECFAKLERARGGPLVTEFNSRWKTVCDGSEMNEELVKIRTLYRKALAGHKPFVQTAYPDLLSRNGNLRLWMPGIALIAAYLQEKKRLSGLFVCATLSAFSRKLRSILQEGADGKYALIGGGNSCPDDYPLHKISVCIEKKNGKADVVFLDSLGHAHLSSPLYNRTVEICKESGASFRFPRIRREFAGHGCAVFALQDSISFLQDPDFVSKLETGKPYPPCLMIGTQSVKETDEYRKVAGEALYAEKIPGRAKSLQEYRIRNFIQNQHGKEQNLYVTRKMLKYMLLITSTLQTLRTEEIRTLLQKTLIT